MSLSNNQMAQLADKMYDVLPDEMSNLELSFIITSLLVQYDSENDWDDVAIAISGMLEMLKLFPPSLSAKNDAEEFMKKITNH
jgi:hypothetical protein